MRAWMMAAVLAGSALGAAAPAGAATLVLPQTPPETYAAYSSQEIDHPWASRTPDSQLHEQPIAQLIATRLGLAEGSAELFRYNLENAPSARTQFDGVVDGGGIKLKLTW